MVLTIFVFQFEIVLCLLIWNYICMYVSSFGNDVYLSLYNVFCVYLKFQVYVYRWFWQSSYSNLKLYYACLFEIVYCVLLIWNYLCVYVSSFDMMFTFVCILIWNCMMCISLLKFVYCVFVHLMYVCVCILNLYICVCG